MKLAFLRARRLRERLFPAIDSSTRTLTANVALSGNDSSIARFGLVISGHSSMISADQHLCHIHAREALYQNGSVNPRNRNRREHASETVRHRLMMLDWALAIARGEHWLLTEWMPAANASRRPGQRP